MTMWKSNWWLYDVTAPKGYARRSLRLQADKMVKLEYIDKTPYETVDNILKVIYIQQKKHLLCKKIRADSFFWNQPFWFNFVFSTKQP